MRCGMEIDQDTQDLELKDRVELIADKLEEYLPADYEDAASPGSAPMLTA